MNNVEEQAHSKTGFLIADINFKEVRCSSSIKHGYLIFPSTFIVSEYNITFEEMLIASFNESVMIGSQEYNLIKLWELFIQNILQKSGLSQSKPTIHLLLPTWVPTQTVDKVFSLLHQLDQIQVLEQKRNNYIAQAYSEGIPPQLALHVVVIEIQDAHISLTAVRRKGSEWQIGKTFTEVVDPVKGDSSLIDWVFSLTDDLFGINEGVMLLDAPESFHNSLVERCKLAGKLVRVELVQNQAVLERTILRLAPALRANASSSDFTSQSPPGASSSTGYSDIVLHPGYSQIETDDPESSHRFLASLKVIFPLLVAVTIAAVIIWTLRMNNEKKLHHQIDQVEKTIFVETSPAMVSPAKTITLANISFELPAGWEVKNLVSPAAQTRKNTTTVVNTTRPWEIMELNVFNHPISGTEIAKHVNSQKNTQNFQQLPMLNHWQQFSYDETTISGTESGAAVVKWTILSGSTSAVQVGCIFAESSFSFPECQSVISSIHMH